MEILGFRSFTYLASSSVPHGSNLGPLLFVLFIDDVSEVLSSQSLLYADDLKIFNGVASLDDCLSLQSSLDDLSDWSLHNRLPLNVSKCKVR